MLKFYIEKRSERGGDGFAGTMEFENHQELEQYLSYNRAYITKIRTLSTDWETN
jgi:hypothetical protein